MPTRNEFISPDDVYDGDPLARILIERWHIRPVKFAVIWILFGFGYMGGLAAAFGYFLPRAGIVASSIDIFNQVNFFLIFPFIAFYYLRQPQKIAETYAALITQVNDQSDRMGKIFEAIGKMTAGKRWWLMCFCLGVLAIAAGIFDNYLKFGRWWYASNWLMIVGLQVSRGLIFYMITIIYARHLVTCIGLNQIYRQFELHSPILPPSQTYGIHAVVHYAFNFTIFAAVVGLSVGLAPILSTRLEPAYPYEVVLYLLLAPLGFFLPLWGAHVELVNSRNLIMDNLSAQYQSEYNQFLVKVAQNDKEVDKGFKQLQMIETAYELAKKSWTWPFDISVLIKVTAAILAPFSITISQVAQKYISDWFMRVIVR